MCPLLPQVVLPQVLVLSALAFYRALQQLGILIIRSKQLIQQQCSSWAVISDMSSFMLPSSSAVRPWDRLQLPEDIRLALFKAAECGRGRQSAAECGRVRRRAVWQEKRFGNEG